MTDFIRTILATAAAANASATNATSAAPSAASQPVNQIHLPPSTAAATAVAAPLAAEKLIKVEPMDIIVTSALPTPTPTADAGKAQRAARRDVVNARRDKRKAMASIGASSPLSPMGLTSCGDSSSDTEDDDMMVAMDDKSKKMKTSATSSVAVAGGLAVSELSVVKKPSFSSSMPPTPGLLFTPEIDAAGEERLRAMEAQLETLDPDSKEAKKKRRLIRNRMSAQLHRERKKAYVGQLEDQLLEKDRELKLLQEKLAQLMAADGSETKPTVTVAATLVGAPAQQQQQPPPPLAASMAKPQDDDIVIKDEPTAWVDAPAWALDAADSWDLHGLEDSEMAELETADLLRDFDDPFAGLLGAGAYSDLGKPHHEIHAAKKNIAMMAAVMFSVSFFGNSPAFYNVTPGSNFGSTFSAQGAAKDLSQMSIASRIVACLEKTSWKEFRTVSSWIAAANAAQDEEGTEHDDDKETSKASVASPSAASDVTSCGSPAGSVGADTDADADANMGDTDLIDEFEYPVEDPFGMAAASADWLDDMEKELPKHTQDHDDAEFFLADVMRHEPVVPKSPKTTTTASSSKSMTSRLYESLTALWREKHQVLLTVRDDKQQVLQRSVADMSTIRDGLESGHFFTKVFGGVEGAAGAGDAEDKSVTFLYPMSAFAGDSSKSLTRDGDATVDPVFLEVSCQLNGLGAAVAKSMD